MNPKANTRIKIWIYQESQISQADIFSNCESCIKRIYKLWSSTLDEHAVRFAYLSFFDIREQLTGILFLHWCNAKNKKKKKRWENTRILSLHRVLRLAKNVKRKRTTKLALLNIIHICNICPQQFSAYIFSRWSCISICWFFFLVCSFVATCALLFIYVWELIHASSMIRHIDAAHFWRRQATQNANVPYWRAGLYASRIFQENWLHFR